MSRQLYVLFLSLVAAAALGACGGGGGGGDTPPGTNPVVPPPTDPSPTSPTGEGQVTSLFVPGTSTRAQYATIGRNVSTRTTAVTQASPKGEVTAFAESSGQTTSISGNYLVKDIAGNAAFALGRWQAGSLSFGDGSATTELVVNSNNALHYLIYNQLSSVPTSGSNRNCAVAGNTTPTYIGGTTASATQFQGSLTSATGSLSFDSAGINVSLVANFSGAGSNASRNIGGTIGSTDGIVFSGTNTFVTAGQGVGDAIMVFVQYQVSVGGGQQYQGVLAMSCPAALPV